MASGDELVRLTAREAVRLLEAGEVSPLELIDAAAARIEAVEPAINALPTLCLDRARDFAKRLPTTRPDATSPEGRGWLAGLPVAIKDLMDVEGVRTTYGSPIHADHVPTASHPLVERIEARGGVVIAKSNTPEFGAGGNTYNEVFGKTRNPWNTALTPAGSTARRPERSGWRTAPTTAARCAARRPSPRRSACARARAGSRAAPPTTCSARARSRGRWRATYRISPCSSTPWPASARTIR